MFDITNPLHALKRPFLSWTMMWQYRFLNRYGGWDLKPTKIPSQSQSATRCTCWEDRGCDNTVMTFPIKKRITTRLLVDRMAALCMGELGLELGPIRVIHL